MELMAGDDVRVAAESEKDEIRGEAGDGAEVEAGIVKRHRLICHRGKCSSQEPMLIQIWTRSQVREALEEEGLL